MTCHVRICHVRIAAFLLVLAAAPVAPAALAAQGHASVLTTTGFGRVVLTPVRAQLTMSIEARSASATIAADSNDRRLAAVLARLNAMPWLDSVRVTDVSIMPVTDGDPGVFVGYLATATVAARLLVLTRVAAVFDAAMQSGATRVGQLRFEADSMDTARRRALAQAFANARDDAAALARASGAHLGRPIRMSTGGADQSVATSSFEEASVTTGASSGNFVNLQQGIINIGTDPGDVTATAYVSAQWEVAP